MTEGFFSDPPDTEPGPHARPDPPHPMVHDVLALDQEYGQQTGLTETAALARLLDLGVSIEAATRAIGQAPQAGDGMTWVDGILVSYAEGYGWAVTQGKAVPSASQYRDIWLALIRGAAGNLALGDAEVGGRVRALLFPAHIHEDDGTVEGCPGCFPPAEVIPDPAADARKASMAAFEEAARYWPDLSGEYNVLEIHVALRLVDAALDAFAPDVYQGADPASRLLNRWRRIAAGPASEGQEAVDALNLATGGNPRKGVVGNDETILGELGDTVVASMLAIQHMTKDTDATWSVFIEALAKAVARVPVPRPAQDAEVVQWGTCQACARSGVGACDDFPDCPNGRPQQ